MARAELTEFDFVWNRCDELLTARGFVDVWLQAFYEGSVARVAVNFHDPRDRRRHRLVLPDEAMRHAWETKDAAQLAEFFSTSLP